MTATTPAPHAMSRACNFTAGFHPQALSTLCTRSPWAGNGGRHLKRLDRWTHVLICQCGYSTPITTLPTARNAIARHKCRPAVPRPVQLELPYDLPAVATSAVVRYLDTRGKRTRLDVDSTAVLRFAGGDHDLRLNALERVAVYALLRSRGEPANRCAELLRLSWSTQARYRRCIEAA